jgi:hypothetical protein
MAARDVHPRDLCTIHARFMRDSCATHARFMRDARLVQGFAGPAAGAADALGAAAEALGAALAGGAALADAEALADAAGRVASPQMSRYSWSLGQDRRFIDDGHEGQIWVSDTLPVATRPIPEQGMLRMQLLHSVDASMRRFLTCWAHDSAETSTSI